MSEEKHLQANTKRHTVQYRITNTHSSMHRQHLCLLKISTQSTAHSQRRKPAHQHVQVLLYCYVPYPLPPNHVIRLPPSPPLPETVNSSVCCTTWTAICSQFAHLAYRKRQGMYPFRCQPLCVVARTPQEAGCMRLHGHCSLRCQKQTVRCFLIAGSKCS